MAHPTVRQVICEAVTDGLSPEVAAAMLLEPSKWREKLFDPTRDLSTVYKQYLRGDLGVGVLSDAVNQVLVASNDMADLTDSIIQTYGQDATPGDIPEKSQVGDIDVEDEQVEVLIRSDDEFVAKIIEHIHDFWPAEILEDLYGETLTEQDGLPGQQVAPAPAQAVAPQPAQPRQPKKRTRTIMPGEKIRPDTLQNFEQGKMFNNILQSAMDINNFRKKIAQLYQHKEWGYLADLYKTGGPLELDLGYLAGDMMVLKDIVDGAVRSGYGDRRIGGVEPIQGLPQTESWEPALLDPEIGDELKQLIHTMNTGASGDISYSQLQSLIQPFINTQSLIFRLARRGTGKSPMANPFSADQTAVQRLSGQGRDAVTQAVAPEVATEPLAGTTQAVEPMRTARDVFSMFDEPGEDDLPLPPEEPEDVIEPELPVEPSPETTSAVAAAAAGEEPGLDDIFSDEIPGAEKMPDDENMQNLLMLKPERAQQFIRFLNRKGAQPGVVVREIEDAYKALAELENIRGVQDYQRKYKDKMPVVAKAMQKKLKAMLDAGEDIQSGPLMAAGLHAQKS